MVSAADHRGTAAHDAAEVLEDEATGSIKGIFDDIRNALRIPFVPPFFTTLAYRPDYLQLAWAQLHPNAQTAYFEGMADEIRALAVGRASAMGAAPPLEGEVARALRTLHYMDAKMLVAVTALRAATTGQRPRMTQLPQEMKRQFVTGPPADMGTVVVLPADTTAAEVQTVFSDIRTTFGSPIVGSDFRVLAQWPEILSAAWSAFKPALDSDGYRAAMRELRLAAEEAVLGLPFRMELNPHTLRHAGLTEADIDWVRSVLNRYHASSLASVMFAAFLAGATMGRDASASPFPVSLQ
jgi:hypothetical protein